MKFLHTQHLTIALIYEKIKLIMPNIQENTEDKLPLWLYFQPQVMELSGHSPVAPFNPAASVNGNPFSGMTSPASVWQKKTLVVTAETMESPYARAVIQYLKSEPLNFNILEWKEKPHTTSDTFKKFTEDDYRHLHQAYHLARDHVEVLQGTNWSYLLFWLQVKNVVMCKTPYMWQYKWLEVVETEPDNDSIEKTEEDSDEIIEEALQNVDVALKLLKNPVILSARQIEKLAIQHRTVAEKLLCQGVVPAGNLGRVLFAHNDLHRDLKSIVIMMFNNNFFGAMPFYYNTYPSSLPDDDSNEDEEVDLAKCQYIAIDLDKEVSRNLNSSDYGTRLLKVITAAEKLVEIRLPEEIKEELSEAFYEFIRERNIDLIFNPAVSKRTTQYIVQRGNINYLYLPMQFTTPENLDARSDSSIQRYDKKPAFSIETSSGETLTIDQQTHLYSMMRMSLQKIYTYAHGSSPEPINPVYGECVAVADTKLIDSTEAKLNLIDFSILEKTTDNGYIIPLLTPKQRLLSCENAYIIKDTFGRWIVYPSPAQQIDSLKLTMAVPLNKAVSEQVIDSSNFNDAKWNVVPAINLIKNIFTRYFSLFEEKNVSCSERVRILLAANKDTNNFFYGSSNGHAYLIIKGQNNVCFRVDLGGSDNFTENYLPVSEAIVAKENKLTKKIAGRNASLVQSNIAVSAKPVSPFKTEEKLTDILANHQKLLLQGSRDLSEKIVRWERQKETSVYWVKHFSQIDYNQKTLKIRGENCFIDCDGFLADFFSQAQKNPEKKFTLIIELDKLSASERVRINTLWDQEKTIQGNRIPNNVKLISMTENALEKTDDSLTSRHDGCAFAVSSKMLAELPLTESKRNGQTIEEVEIDLCGYPNWQEVLLGTVQLHNNQLVWKPTPFIKENPKISIKNVPAEDFDAIKQYIEQSQAQGYFLYHGNQIPFPSGSDIEVFPGSFMFSDFAGLSMNRR